MLSKLLEALGVREEERTQVLLMLGAGFFMGIFLATYSVVAESLFLNNLGNQLNQAFFYAGAFGIVATLAFSFAQNHIRFTTLTTSAIILVVAVTTVFYVGYHFGPREYQEPIIFTMFCMTGPITTVLLLSYWGIFGRLFNFRQSKRIIGWIDTGQLTAVILATLLIPLTTALFRETDNYLIVSVCAIIISASFFIIISFRFALSKNDPKEFGSEAIKEASLPRVVKDPYTRLLSTFLVISMVTLILGQFTFQELIKVQYPNQTDLTNFLAYFNAAIFGLSFVMQTFINDRIVGNYGIRIALMLLPTIVGVFALSATISGTIFGYTPEMAPQTFAFFFLFVALTRLFNNMIRDSLENPMFKLLFIPLDGRSRFGIQSKVEGLVNEMGRFAAGALIILFASLAAFKILWMPIILLALSGLYFVIIQKMYGGYKAKIRSKLEAAQSSAEHMELGTDRMTRKLEGRLLNVTPETAVFAYKLLEKLHPESASKWVNLLIRNELPEVHEFAQDRMNELKGLSVSEQYIIKYDPAKVQVAGKNLLSRSEVETLIRGGGDINKARLTKLARSLHAGDRQYAAELLLHAINEENASYLIELLADSVPSVRYAAIKTSVKRSSPEVIRALIENLANPQYSNQAADALMIIGGKALNILDTSFYRTGQSTQVLNSIVQIIGHIGGQHAKEILWNKIDYPDKVVVSRVLLALGDTGFKANNSQGPRIRYAIESDIGDIAWNYGALAELGSSEEVREVREAVRNEVANDIDHVYMLLGMLYEARSIQLVKENIESGTVEGTAFAVELVDVFLSDQLKQRFIPCIDELSEQERIRRLEVFYPRMALDERLVLKFLINRDFTQTNRWTKSCVLRQIGKGKMAEFSLDLIAQLFNPDPLIREQAAWSLHEVNPEEYERNTERLGHDVKKELDAMILPGHSKRTQSLYDRISFYRSLELFKGTPTLALTFLADWSVLTVLAPSQTMVIDEGANSDFYVVNEGVVEYFQRGELKRMFSHGQFIGETVNFSGHVNSNILISKEGATLLRIGKDHLYEVMASNLKLADRVLEYV